MFQTLNAEEGITIILVTHDASVANYAKRAIRIMDGLIENGMDEPNALPSGIMAATPGPSVMLAAR